MHIFHCINGTCGVFFTKGKPYWSLVCGDDRRAAGSRGFTCQRLQARWSLISDTRLHVYCEATQSSILAQHLYFYSSLSRFSVHFLQHCPGVTPFITTYIKIQIFFKSIVILLIFSEVFWGGGWSIVLVKLSLYVSPEFVLPPLWFQTAAASCTADGEKEGITAGEPGLYPALCEVGWDRHTMVNKSWTCQCLLPKYKPKGWLEELWPLAVMGFDTGGHHIGTTWAPTTTSEQTGLEEPNNCGITELGHH